MSKKIVSVILGISFIFFSMAVDGSDLLLPSLITSNRLAIAILLITVFFLLYTQKDFYLYKKSLPLSLIIIGIVYIGLLSFLLSPYQEITSVIPVINWLLISLVVFLIINLGLNGYYKEEIFMNSILIGSSIIILYTLFIAINSVGLGNLLTSSYTLRNILHDYYSNGLSRFLNGLFVLNCINYGVISGVIKRKSFFFLIALLNFFIFLFLVLILGSRQILIAILGYIVIQFLYKKVLAISKNKQKFSINSTLRISFLSIFSGVLIYMLLQSTSFVHWFNSRFIETSLNQYQEEDIRIVLIKKGFSVFLENPLLGAGPGTVQTLIGRPAHNGFIDLLVTFGFFPLLLIIILLSIVLYKSFKIQLSKENEIVWNQSLIVFVPLIIVFFLISNNFNELLDEYILWVMIALVIFINNFNTSFNSER